MEDKPLLYVYADIRVGMETWPPQRLEQYLQGIQAQLKHELPQYRVMVGIVPLSFTIADPKQEFTEKLKGTIPTSI
jgi:hypothetical protein